MLNKLQQFIRKYVMVKPGDTVICAVSGGADSIALLWGLFLLKDTLQIRLEAAHFNHNLRGEESLRDETFVVDFCKDYGIHLHIGRGEVQREKKGLEAAARVARYSFFRRLHGKIATAHTADDNAETVLMHMLRGTGLKGLGGITPVCNNLIRPMLEITREEVMTFVEEYHLPYVMDSSNASDEFLRNRVRHHIMPLLCKENPKFSTAISSMAQNLRQDETELFRQAETVFTNDVRKLRLLSQPIRTRVLTMLLESYGVAELSAEHLALLDRAVMSEKPSASVDFPGNIKVGRVYDHIQIIDRKTEYAVPLDTPGSVELKELGIRVVAEKSSGINQGGSFVPHGNVIVRSRKAGDEITLPGGTKSLKKLYIDRKIPAFERNTIPVIADDAGVVGVYGVGMNIKRIQHDDHAICIRFETI